MREHLVMFVVPIVIGFAAVYVARLAGLSLGAGSVFGFFSVLTYVAVL